ncbi:MAG: hypothetical protein IJH63_00380 [Methanobrevibacter sp.]|nr:hypothetical protein [Methanobrevibacter sp.]
MYDYDNLDSKLFNISIDGLDLIGESFSPSESYNRRELSRHTIIGGTQKVIRTTYVQRDFTFNTHVRIDPLYPDIYDSTFRLWMSKPVEVVSKELGGKFNAECTVKKTHENPSSLSLEIHLIEIPDENSLIPNDNFIVPYDKILPKVKVTTKDSSKSKDKSKKKNKKVINKSKKVNSKNKGGKITSALS